MNLNNISEGHDLKSIQSISFKANDRYDMMGAEKESPNNNILYLSILLFLILTNGLSP